MRQRTFDGSRSRPASVDATSILEKRSESSAIFGASRSQDSLLSSFMEWRWKQTCQEQKKTKTVK